MNSRFNTSFNDLTHEVHIIIPPPKEKIALKKHFFVKTKPNQPASYLKDFKKANWLLHVYLCVSACVAVNLVWDEPVCVHLSLSKTAVRTQVC